MNQAPSRDRFVHRVDVELLDAQHTDSRAGLDRPPEWASPAVDGLVCDRGGSRVPTADRDLEIKRVVVLFPDPITLSQGQQLRLVDPRGRTRIFLVDSFHDDQDLGRLWVASCTEHVDPAPTR